MPRRGVPFAVTRSAAFVVAWFIKAEPLRGGAAATPAPEPAVVLGEPVLEDEVMLEAAALDDETVGASSSGTTSRE